jgi:hypothetical protein
VIDDEAFVAELDRLIEGIGAKPVGVAQRAAIFDAVVWPARLTAPDWKRVIDLAIASGRWPSIDQWEKYVERARQQDRGPRATSMRRCDCGGAFEPRGEHGWIYLLAGRQPQGMEAARDRIDFPDRWVPAAEYGCTVCSALGFLLLDDARFEPTGRRYRHGEFVVAKSGRSFFSRVSRIEDPVVAGTSDASPAPLAPSVPRGTALDELVHEAQDLGLYATAPVAVPPQDAEEPPPLSDPGRVGTESWLEGENGSCEPAGASDAEEVTDANED